jgi:hypothetical protein
MENKSKTRHMTEPDDVLETDLVGVMFKEGLHGQVDKCVGPCFVAEKKRMRNEMELS